MTKSFKRALVAISLVGVLVLLYFLFFRPADEDRPPIIVENGSIDLWFKDADDSGKEWKLEAPGRYEQVHSKSKDVLSFSATDRTCTITADAGTSIKVGYDTVRTFTIEAHQKNGKGKFHVDAVFAEGVTVDVDNSNPKKRLLKLPVENLTLDWFEGVEAGKPKRCPTTGAPTRFEVAAVH